MTLPRARHVLLLAFGFAVGGWFGLAVAGLGLVAMQRSREQAMWLPAELLAIAALATILPDLPSEGSLRPSYATDRPLAAAAGLAAAVLLAVVFVESVATTHRSTPSASVTAKRLPLTGSSAWLKRHGPVLAAATMAAALRLAVGGDALSGAEVDAVALLRDGGELTVSLPPVAVTLATTSPVSATLLTAILAATLVVAVTELIRRLDSAPAAWTVAAVAAALPLTWAMPLAVTVGLLGLVSALLALWPPAPTPGSTFLGGILLGLATLARPELFLLAIASLAWCAVRPSPLRPAPFVGVIAAFVLTVAPWVIHVQHRTGSPNLASPLDTSLKALEPAVGGLAIAVTIVLLAAASVVAIVQQRQWLSRHLIAVLPLVAGAVVGVSLLAAGVGVVALYPSMPLVTLVLARGMFQLLNRRGRVPDPPQSIDGQPPRTGGIRTGGR